MSDSKRLALVIGAGPAGLSAAYQLYKEGWDGDVVMLEQDNQVGGISKTVEFKGNRIDFGGHRFFSKSDVVCQTWDELMPLQGAPSFDDIKLGRTRAWAPNGPDPEKENNVMLLRQRLSRLYFKGNLLDYPMGRSLDVFKTLGIFECISLGISYVQAVLSPRKEVTLEDFYINRFGKKLYSLFFEGYTEKLWGIHPSKLSPDFGAQRVRGVSIWAVLKDFVIKFLGLQKKKVEASLIDEFHYPKLGVGQYWEKMASSIEEHGGKIVYNTKVEEFELDGTAITKVICKGPEGRTEYTPDLVFSSMPVRELMAGMAKSVLTTDSAKGSQFDSKVFETASQLAYRSLILIAVLVSKLDLQNKTKDPGLGGIVPDCWMYVQDGRVKMGRIQLFNNWSPYMVKDPEHTVWLGGEFFCDENDEFWNAPNEAKAKQAVEEFHKLKVLSSENVLDTFVTYVPKAYPIYHGAYYKMPEIIKELDKVDNLYCVGRNGQHRYNNMDHSMLTGILAAQHAMGKLKDKSCIWNVNSELEYHEQK